MIVQNLKVLMLPISLQIVWSMYRGHGTDYGVHTTRVSSDSYPLYGRYRSITDLPKDQVPVLHIIIYNV